MTTLAIVRPLAQINDGSQLATLSTYGNVREGLPKTHSEVKVTTAGRGAQHETANAKETWCDTACEPRSQIRFSGAGLSGLR